MEISAETAGYSPGDGVDAWRQRPRLPGAVACPPRARDPVSGSATPRPPGFGERGGYHQRVECPPTPEAAGPAEADDMLLFLAGDWVLSEEPSLVGLCPIDDAGRAHFSECAQFLDTSGGSGPGHRGVAHLGRDRAAHREAGLGALITPPAPAHRTGRRSAPGYRRPVVVRPPWIAGHPGVRS